MIYINFPKMLPFLQKRFYNLGIVMKASPTLLRLLAITLLMPCVQAGEAESPSLSHRRAMFRVRQDIRLTERAMSRLTLLPWQRESIQLLLNEQSRVAEIFRLGSDLEGRDFEAKIQELIDVTHYKIGLALPPEQQMEWAKLVARHGLSFASRGVLAGRAPDAPSEP